MPPPRGRDTSRAASRGTRASDAARAARVVLRGATGKGGRNERNSRATVLAAVSAPGPTPASASGPTPESESAAAAVAAGTAATVPRRPRRSSERGEGGGYNQLPQQQQAEHARRRGRLLACCSSCARPPGLARPRSPPRLRRGGTDRQTVRQTDCLSMEPPGAFSLFLPLRLISDCAFKQIDDDLGTSWPLSPVPCKALATGTLAPSLARSRLQTCLPRWEARPSRPSGLSPSHRLGPRTRRLQRLPARTTRRLP